MSTRTVVTRKQRVVRGQRGQFAFTADMIPATPGEGQGAQFVRDFRQRAWSHYEATPMPTASDEPWRRTDLRAMDAGGFKLPAPDPAGELGAVPEALLQPLVGDQPGGQIEILPGGEARVVLQPALAEQGVVFTDLRTAAQEHAEILADILGKIVPPEDGKFSALAAALAPNGVLVYVPRGVQVELPLHSVLWGPGSGLAHFSHLLVWLEEGANLTYVHEASSPEGLEGQTLHAGNVEIRVGAGANLRFVELQSWGEHVWNFTHERASIGRDSQLDWIYGTLGTSLTKSFMDLDLEGQGAWGRMSGFFFTHNRQHLDLDTQQNHKAPNTTSDLLYKGALEGNSRTVWQGMIYVAPGAQQTDGYQANRNLVLSKSARADSIPGLEILADDVRCTHGATVGKIDPELLFYLRSRGLAFQDAKRMVVEGFFDPVMQRIPFEGVRERFAAEIQRKIGQDE